MNSHLKTKENMQHLLYFRLQLSANPSTLLFISIMKKYIPFYQHLKGIEMQGSVKLQTKSKKANIL